MPTLVLPPRYTPDSVALWREATAAGWDVIRLHGWRAPSELAGTDVVLYGEPLFAAVVADDLNLALLEPPMSWLADLSETYRLRDVRFTTLSQARQISQPTFVKPANDKCFIARVYPSGAELPPLDLLPESTPVLTAEPVAWEIEFRCFVLNGEVVTLSPYLRNGELAQAADGTWPASEQEMSMASAYANAVLTDPGVKIPPAVVLDVGLIQGRGWAVIETNAAWGSGIYGCEPAEVLRVVQRACVRKDRLTREDCVWVATSGT